MPDDLPNDEDAVPAEHETDESVAHDSAIEPSLDETERSRGPNLVYGALGAGAVVLGVLLLIVWLSSRDDGGTNLPLCLDIAAAAASEAILDGQVETIDVLVDQEEPLKGLTAIQLQMTDGECRRLPEGADNREDLYVILGVVALFNEAGPQQVDVRYLRESVPEPLMNTSTPEPTETLQPSVTAEATLTPEVTSTPSSEPTRTPTIAPSPESSPPVPDASPETSPVSASPVAAASASPEASPQASPSPGTPATPVA